jgi:quinol monooxygenase YgiN
LVRRCLTFASFGSVPSPDEGEHVGVGRPRNEGEAVNELWGIARVKFHEGKVEEFKRLSAQLMEIAKTKDTGTLQYEIYLNDDESEAVVLERYRSSAALIEHGANQGDLAAAIFATGTFVGEVLGDASADLKAKLADAPVRILTPHLSM